MKKHFKRLAACLLSVGILIQPLPAFGSPAQKADENSCVKTAAELVGAEFKDHCNADGSVSFTADLGDAAFKLALTAQEIADNSAGGVAYLKVLAKIPYAATSGNKNSPVFSAENGAQVEKVNLGEFTKGDTYQTVVREFATDKNGVSFELKYLGEHDVSDLTIKKIAVSANPDPLDGTEATQIGISWPDDQLLPSFGTPADTVIAVDMLGASVTDIVTARAVQGIVNRTRPRITIFESLEGNSIPKDAWEKSMDIKYKNIAGANPHTRLKNLLEMYKDEIKGCVRYDSTEENIQSLNVATTVCGIKDSVPFDVKQAAEFANMGFKVTEDLTGKGWGPSSASRIAAYQYLYDNYKGQYCDRTILNINPGTNMVNSTTQEYAPQNNNTRIRDLAVAMKIPVVWLDAKTYSERKVIDSYYQDIRDAHPISEDKVCPVSLGFFPTESEGIRESSKYGITHVPSDNFGNYTLYSALPREIDPAPVPAKPKLENVNYVSIISSDGDNICTSQGATRKTDMWASAKRSQSTIGWTIDPALLDAAPQMLQYYEGGAKAGDSLLAGPSGLGYSIASYHNWGIISSCWPSLEWAENYGAWTNSYFERMSLKSATVWNTLKDDQQERYLAKFPAMLGHFLQNNQKDKQDGSEYFSGNVPVKVFSPNGSYVDNPDKWDNEIIPVIAALPEVDAPTFHAYQPQNFCIRVPRIADQQAQIKRDNKAVKFVRSDHYFMLMQEAAGKPINNALRAATFASGADEGYESSRATDGSFGRTHGWKSSAAGEKWLAVDLGARLPISGYVIKNAETACYPAVKNTKDFKIQGSNDQRNWTDIDTVTDNAAAIVRRDVECDAKYRFIRIYITNAGADGVARIQDFEILGVNDPAPVDSTDLKSEITESVKITEQGDYITALWENFVKAKEYAQTIAEKTDATQTAIDNAMFALRDAREALAPLNVTALNEALKLTETVVPQPADKPVYSAKSWAAYTDALAKAQEIVKKAGERPVMPQQNEADEAEKALRDAIAGLGIDNTALLAAINRTPAPDKQDQYTKSTWDAMMKALKTAENAYANATKQYELDEAQIALDRAVNGLTVMIRVQSVSVASNTINLIVGKSGKILASVFPSDAMNKTLAYTSSAPKIVTVDQAGNVKAKSAGKAVITVKSADGAYAAVTVKVTPKTPKKPVVKVKGKKLLISWKKLSGATGAQVYIARNGKKVKLVRVTKRTYKFKAKKGKYTVKIRSYKKSAGKYYYSKYTKKVTRKVK